MKLFFETALQARVFLAALPIGFMLAVCFDATFLAGRLRPFWDAVTMLLCGAAMLLLLMLTREGGLRLYHLLALLAGGLLYLCGIGRLLRTVLQKHRQRKQKKASGQAGIGGCTSKG